MALTQEDVDRCVAIHDGFVRLMQARGWFSSAYRAANDIGVVQARHAVIKPLDIPGLRGSTRKDLTGLPDRDKKLIVAMGLKHQPSNLYECRWCGKMTREFLTDNELALQACSVNCMLASALLQSGLFKTKLQVNKFMNGGGTNAAKKPARPRVRRAV